MEKEDPGTEDADSSRKEQKISANVFPRNGLDEENKKIIAVRNRV